MPTTFSICSCSPSACGFVGGARLDALHTGGDGARQGQDSSILTPARGHEPISGQIDFGTVLWRQFILTLQGAGPDLGKTQLYKQGCIRGLALAQLSDTHFFLALCCSVTPPSSQV